MKKAIIFLSIACVSVFCFYLVLENKKSSSAVSEVQTQIDQNVKSDYSQESDSEKFSWGYNALSIEEVQKNYKVFGENVSIAILDTGISKHQDIKIKGGINIIDKSLSYEDDNGHGTFLAGIISNISPMAEIYAVKVLKEDQTGTYEGIASGIDWAIENNIDVILMSFGGMKDSVVLKNAIRKAYDENIILIASTGNTALSNNIITYPAKYQEVIAVGAITKENKTWIGSNTGEEVTTMAPGHKVLSTMNDGTYSTQSGTSLAAAHIAGSIALCKSYNRELVNDEVKQIVFKAYSNKTPDGYGIFSLIEAIKHF
ncbi:S8 family serine peptidase [Rossellomorea aquimaris]